MNHFIPSNKQNAEYRTLANELILSIFEYFYSIHLLHSFHNFNSRFNNLFSHLDITFPNGIFLPLPTKISQSIEYLSFQHDQMRLEDLVGLFQTTSYLQNLSIYDDFPTKSNSTD